jgi:uncharacterized protein YdaU (DUF1376 family)
MAKDPAFLFYSSDFLTGTMFMTNEQVGLYIRLLCAQHQHGGRIDTNVLRTQCESITNGSLVYSKFEHDDTGSFSVRLDEEMKKRKEKGIKARESVNKRWNKDLYDSNTNVLRSEDENENVIKDKKEDKKESTRENQFKKPTQIEISIHLSEKYPTANKNSINTFSEKFWSHYENNGWKVGKNKMKNWKLALTSWSETIQKDLFPSVVKSIPSPSFNSKNMNR